jgi:gluconokinase
MGVAGCGKTLLAAQLAQRLRLPLIEGDDFHAASEIEKVRLGTPPGADDHAGWVRRVGAALRAQADGAVLIWPALKREERAALRAAVPGLRFVYLALTPHQALERAAARTDQFYPPSHVAAQFEALEEPLGEPGVQVLDGTQHLDRSLEGALRWLAPAFNNA